MRDRDGSTRMKSIGTFCLFVVLGLGHAVPIPAAVMGVAASPSSHNLPLGRSSSVSLAWATATDAAGEATIASDEGVFVTPTGVPLGKIQRPMWKPVGGPSTLTLAESILVPASVIAQAHTSGFNKLIYRRSFDDGDMARTGQITLHIVVPASTGFSISRLALQFDDGRPVRSIPSHDPLQVQANITFAGSGFLRAIWELARPSSPDGNRVYQPLLTVRHYLTGGEPIVLNSPDLPTDMVGQYHIRLRIHDPQPGFDIPVIQYFVGQDQG